MVFHVTTFGLVPLPPPCLSSCLCLHRLATPEVPGRRSFRQVCPHKINRAQAVPDCPPRLPLILFPFFYSIFKQAQRRRSFSPRLSDDRDHKALRSLNQISRRRVGFVLRGPPTLFGFENVNFFFGLFPIRAPRLCLRSVIHT